MQIIVRYKREEVEAILLAHARAVAGYRDAEGFMCEDFRSVVLEIDAKEEPGEDCT